MDLHYNLTVVEGLFNKSLIQSSLYHTKHTGALKRKIPATHLNQHLFPFISMQLVNKVQDQEQITISDINKCILRRLPYTMYKFVHAKLKGITAVFLPTFV